MCHRRTLASAIALAACVATAAAGAQAVPEPARAASVRVTGGLGFLYVHQPGFTFTRGSATPRQLVEPDTDGAGLSLGGGLEVVGARWWGGIGAQFLVTVFDEGNAVIATAHAGRVLPRVLAGTLRVGLGPVLARTERRERTIRGCFTDCTPVVYPSLLATAGLGVVLAQEWQLWEGIRLGLEGQMAGGAQRFAGGRLRIAVGS